MNNNPKTEKSVKFRRIGSPSRTARAGFGSVARVLDPAGRVVGRSHGQRVAAVVLHGLGVPLDPDEADPVAAVDAQETLPEVGVLLPGKPLLFPAEDPSLRDGIDDVFRVGVEGDVRSLELERFEGHADGREFHAVVGRQAVALCELLAVGAGEQDGSVAARSGVSEGRAVGVDRDLWHCALLDNAVG